MDKYQNFMSEGKKPMKDVGGTEENVLFGCIGAFLFSLAGGVLYVLLDRIGFVAALSGLVAVVCAIKGYSFFGKKETKRGLIISVVIAALVLVLAWYVSFCIDIVTEFSAAFDRGEVDYVPTFFESMRYGYSVLPEVPVYFVNLGLGLALGALGGGRYIVNKLRRDRAAAESEVATDPYFDNGTESFETSTYDDGGDKQD